MRVGDEVNHLRYEEWGIGVVTEVMTSSIPGGTCLARVRFQDGQLRCFNNDLDNDACCYYFGVRRYWNPTHGVDAIRANIFLKEITSEIFCYGCCCRLDDYISIACRCFAPKMPSKKPASRSA